MIKNSKFPFTLAAYILPTTYHLLFLSGCATAPLPQPPVIQPNIPGIYYKVQKGQTLWRISKMFNADLDELARINHIPDTSSLETGQAIFIPQAPKQQAQPLLSTEKFPADDFIWPLKGRVIGTYGITFRNMLNKGILIQPLGNTDVVASRSGRVVFCHNDFRGFGKTLIIDHGDSLSTVYARNAELFVKPGDMVPRGAVIAKAGSAGKDKNVYLHFEIRKGSLSQNPLFYLP